MMKRTIRFWYKCGCEEMNECCAMQRVGFDTDAEAERFLESEGNCIDIFSDRDELWKESA